MSVTVTPAVGTARHGARRPLAAAPRVTGGLLDTWHARNRATTLPHGIAMLEEYGNLDNLRRLTGESDAEYRGMIFADSDIYKTLEAAAWELGREEDTQLRAFFDRTVELVARAQQPDGYLDSAFLNHPDRAPWTDFAQGHELYCLGHLVQAAVAAHRALGDDRLLRVAERFVAHVDARMGRADAPEYCGHPLIETALIELYRTTGDEMPLRLAESFVRRRGAGFLQGVTFGARYYQDDVPALDATTLRGHAVRALYLNQGITDLYLETADATALQTMRAQWEDLITRRVYLTGGTGSRHEDEAFGDAYELPPDRAYAETCAGVALFGWAWRMYLATGEASCLDVAEIALYNAVAAGISATGDGFTYVNPLQVRDERPHGGDAPPARRRWFSCACCPPNLMRTFATLEHHLAAERPDGIDLALYATAEIRAHGARLEVTTDYPADGRVTIRVHGDAAPGRRRLALRVPAWATHARVTRDGALVSSPPVDGWIVLDDALRDGTTVELDLPLQPVVVHPHPRIDAVRGCVAVQRGPVVYCAVAPDDAGAVDDVTVEGGDLRFAGGDGVLGPRLVLGGTRLAPGSAPLYATASDDADGVPVTVELRPFAEYDGGAAMRVWLPRAPR